MVGLKIEDCEGTLLANLQSSGGGPVIKKFVFFLTWLDWRLKIEDCERTLLANLQSTAEPHWTTLVCKQMLFNAKNQILKNARVQSCGYDGPAWATRRVDPITGIPVLAWPKRGTAVDPLEGDQPHVRNCLRGRQSSIFNLQSNHVKNFLKKNYHGPTAAGLKIGKKSSLAIFNLQSSIQPR